MAKEVITRIVYAVLIAVVVLGLLKAVQAATANIDPTNKWAWGTNIGWINFAPTHGGVTVDPATDNFDGYAWRENVGWIQFKDTAYNVAPPFGGNDIYLPVILKQGT